MYRKQVKKRRGKVAADQSFVIFRVQDMEFSFNLDDLSEIIQYKEATRVPMAPSFIRGIVSVGGELVPVIDLCTRFDLPKDRDSDETRIIVIRKGDTFSGIVADSVSEIMRVPREDMVPAPKIVKGIDTRFIEGMIRIKKTNRAPIILNIEEILKGAEKEKDVKKAAGKKK